MSAKQQWTASAIRQQFFDFFEQRGHKIVPSAPIVLKDDPSLMFTNAGMNQFKESFLGNREAPDARVADSQKCLRVSGKHNDLEEVGHDTYHHTMFEMLGNWSFGDYFKKETIDWAWELLTKVYGLNPEQLYATIFTGDQEDKLDRDEEAAEAWRQWLPAERILEGSKKDNFWEMGATGPCGPSSEIHIDLRPEVEKAKSPGAELVNQDHPQVVEIWNLVFMQFNRKADGSLERLPAQHVDTGMGFERLCMALQGVRSNYDTDVFQPLIQKIAQGSGRVYGASENTDVAMRVIADHLRAVAFAIADGQLPSNSGAGYVIRRILRRAIRYGFTFLNRKEPHIYALVATLEAQMGPFFPELSQQKTLVEKVIQEEEQSFLRTLETGLQRLDQIIASSQDGKVPGAQVFELYDTYGFPPDLTALILKERGLHYDEAEYAAEMAQQKARARAAGQQAEGDWIVLRTDDREEFVGYDRLSAEVKITRYRSIETKKGRFFQLVFNLTPFYPEGGGQVGDQGWLERANQRWEIFDTRKEHGLILHLCRELPSQIEAGFTARVDEERRSKASLNHSATHLLHQALREILGEHVEQKGSLVHPDYLRFDFSHFGKVSPEEQEAIEQRVNALIRANHPKVEKRNIPMEEAVAEGALALFGEKYGDTVRAIRFGDSLELCGGIHVEASGAIGFFALTGESAVAAGIRRIEALTGERALNYWQEQRRLMQALRLELKNPKDLLSSLQQMRQEQSALRKELEKAAQKEAQRARVHWEEQITALEEGEMLVLLTDLPAGQIKNLLIQMSRERPGLAAVAGTQSEGKAQLAVALGEEWVQSQRGHAGQWIKELTLEIKGGGGGKPNFAMAGGSDPSGLERALQKAKALITGK